MEDKFYEAYFDALKAKDVGKFDKWQRIIGTILIIAIVLSVVGFVFFGAINRDECAYWCVGIYTATAILASILVAWFEKKRREKLYVNNHLERVTCMKQTIDQFLCEGKYYEKIEFLSGLYENSYNKRIEKQKTIRKGVWAYLTVIGVLLTNMVNAPDNTILQTIIVFAMVILFFVALTIIPFLLCLAFDTKKRVYEYMVLELQCVKLMMMGQEESLEKANKEELINRINEVKKCFQKCSVQEKKEKM